MIAQQKLREGRYACQLRLGTCPTEQFPSGCVVNQEHKQSAKVFLNNSAESIADFIFQWQTHTRAVPAMEV